MLQCQYSCSLSNRRRIAMELGGGGKFIYRYLSRSIRQDRLNQVTGPIAYDHCNNLELPCSTTRGDGHYHTSLGCSRRNLLKQLCVGHHLIQRTGRMPGHTISRYAPNTQELLMPKVPNLNTETFCSTPLEITQMKHTHSFRKYTQL